MTTKPALDNLDAYMVSVLQSPYTKETFALADVEAFQKHLRKEERVENERRRAAAATELRINYWRELRQSANSLSDIIEGIAKMPARMNAYYVSRSRSSEKDPWLLDTNKETLKSIGITHSAPLGHGTNWGGHNKDLPRTKIALVVQLANNPNSVYGDYKHESGISSGMRTLELFADDWSFVAREALWALLERRLPIPEEYEPDERKRTKPKVSLDLTTFKNDIHRYALQICGTEWSTLKSLHDSGVLSRESFIHLVRVHEGQMPSGKVSLDLPSNLDDDLILN